MFLCQLALKLDPHELDEGKSLTEILFLCFVYLGSNSVTRDLMKIKNSLLLLKHT